MSGELFNIASQNDLSIQSGPTGPGRRLSKNFGVLARQVLRWSEQIAGSIQDLVLNLDHTKPYRYQELSTLANPYYSEIRRFLLAVDAHYESSTRPWPETRQECIRLALRPDCAEYFKRVRQKSCCKFLGCSFATDPEWFNEVPDLFLGPEDIFYYKYLPMWDEPHTNDILKMTEDLPYDEEEVLHFKSSLNAILDTMDLENYKFLHEEEILLHKGSNKAYDVHTGKTQYDYILKQDHKYFFEKEKLFGKYARVPVHPAGFREVLVMSPDTVNSIKYVEDNLNSMMQILYENCMNRSYEVLDNKIQNFSNSFDYFYCRDIEKEGLTKPRIIIKTIVEELQKRFPNSLFSDCLEIFKNVSFEFEGQILKAHRGHGLGTANSITTLMQITLHRMNLDQEAPMGIDNVENPVGYLAYNDDSVAGFRTPEDAENYMENDFVILENLGIVGKRTKSILGQGFVFLERYFRYAKEYPKDNIWRTVALLPFLCNTIAEAKELYNSLELLAPVQKFLKIYFREITSFWGYEFFDGEARLPFTLGGWSTPRYNQFDLSLLKIDYEDLYTTLLYKLFKACTVKYYKKVKNRDKIYKGPLYNHFQIVPEDYFRGYLNEFVTMESIATKYERKKDLGQRFADKVFFIQRLRISVFNREKEIGAEDLTKFIYEYRKIYKNSISPPGFGRKIEVKHYEGVKEYPSSLSNIYKSKNAWSAFLAFYNKKNKKVRERYSLYSLFKQNEWSDIKYLALIFNSPNFTLDLPTYRIKGTVTDRAMLEQIDNEEEYVSTYISLYKTDHIWWIDQPDEIAGLLKEEVFGRRLTPEEIIYFENQKVPRSIIKNLIKLGYSLDEIKKIYTLFGNRKKKIQKKISPKRVLFKPSSTSSESEDDDEPNEFASMAHNYSAEKLTYFTWLERGCPLVINMDETQVYIAIQGLIWRLTYGHETDHEQLANRYSLDTLRSLKSTDPKISEYFKTERMRAMWDSDVYIPPKIIIIENKVEDTFVDDDDNFNPWDALESY